MIFIDSDSQVISTFLIYISTSPVVSLDGLDSILDKISCIIEIIFIARISAYILKFFFETISRSILKIASLANLTIK